LTKSVQASGDDAASTTGPGRSAVAVSPPPFSGSAGISFQPPIWGCRVAAARRAHRRRVVLARAANVSRAAWRTVFPRV